MHLLDTPPADDLAAAMRTFIIAQGDGRTEETRQRYVRVADDLAVFLGGVDVAPWLGKEIATLYELGRRGGGDLLTTLGLSSFIRVLPAFVDDPWLPPPGVQRRTHRAAARYLMTFLRARALQEGCLRKDDFKVIDRALGRAYSRDYSQPPAARQGTVSCNVTLDLVEHLLDRLLEDVTNERHATLDDAIAARLNPVQVTIWRDPEPDCRDEWPGLRW